LSGGGDLERALGGALAAHVDEIVKRRRVAARPWTRLAQPARVGIVPG